MDRIGRLISEAKRPLLWAGNGIRLAGEVERFRAFVERTNLPVVTTWTGADLLPTHHPQNLGIVGVCGQRGANMAVAECDVLLVLGSHLSTCQTGPADTFSPSSYRIVVEIDGEQLGHIGVRVDLPIHGSLETFFDAALSFGLECYPQYHSEKLLSGPPPFGSYALNAGMTRLLPPGTAIVVDGGGTALYTGFQSSYIKEGTRLICSSSMSSMGSGLPEAIGACFANGRRLTTCLIGDGSLMLNLQELQTIATHRLPIKVFVIENGGYLAIRQTQKSFQEARYFGVGAPDLTFPEIWRLAETFGIPYTTDTEDALETDGPCICEWKCSPEQPMLRQGFKDGKPLPLTEMVIE
jgi:acetolactate synthase-1/2/3 large subunit